METENSDLRVQVHAKKASPSRLSCKTKNAVHVIIGFWRKADKQGRIQALQLKNRLRKQAFGVQYLDLYQRHPDAMLLDQCLQAAWSDICALNETVAQMQEEIARIETDTKTKIARTKASHHTRPSVITSEGIKQPLYAATSGAQTNDSIVYSDASVAVPDSEEETVVWKTPRLHPVFDAHCHDDENASTYSLGGK
jgi:uncharacterized small protein (DUF1192 family)